VVTSSEVTKLNDYLYKKEFKDMHEDIAEMTAQREAATIIQKYVRRKLEIKRHSYRQYKQGKRFQIRDFVLRRMGIYRRFRDRRRTAMSIQVRYTYMLIIIIFAILMSFYSCQSKARSIWRWNFVTPVVVICLSKHHHQFRFRGCIGGS
jgi:hypothetical protein